MNAIDFMTKQILNEIPKQLLMKGLMNKFNTNYTLDSVENLIKDEILHGIYIPDMDVAYGTNTFLYINDATVSYTDESSIAYFFPQDKLGGLDIVSSHGLYNHVANDLIGGFSKMRYNAMLLPNTSVSIVAPNTVLVSARGYFRQELYDTALHVVLTNNNELANIGPRWYQTLAEGAILVTKRFLYNELSISENMSALYKGSELGMFNEILSSYSEAAVEYREFTQTKLAKSLLMNDRNAYTTHIRSQLSPALQAKFNK